MSEIKIDPSRSVLLMIDMERGFVDPEAALCVKGAAATVPMCNKMTMEARKLGIKIIWVKREYAEDFSDVEIPRRKFLESLGLQGGVMSPGSTGVNSVEEPVGLVRLPDEHVLIKPRYSAFFNTYLNETLIMQYINTVLIAGTTTPNCIRTTCYDAISYDFRPIILEQCTSSATDEIQRANIEDMARVGAEIYYGDTLYDLV
ncbi:MAG: cysteine hydrolase [Mogibacterium sp.]|nr:cysteine hydrolase [Mogibacterium sp.]